MARSRVPVAIVGAGPYGLSIATHLRSRGIEFRIFGSTMRTWLDMPPGVALKSFDFATNIYTPWPGHTFKEWAAARGQALEEPIPMSVFAEYGVEIQTQLVPEVEDVEVRSVVPAAGGGFGVTLSTGESFDADSVVVAVGLKSYARMPATFANHPGRVFHTSDIPDYARFRGQDVTVIGGGQSALEAGQLLAESGATARMLVRADWGVWFAPQSDPDTHPSLLQRIKYPQTVMGPGLLNWVLEHFPRLAYYMPERRRVRLVRNHLGPFGTWWLKDTIERQVPILSGAETTAVREEGDGLILTVRTPAGTQEIRTDAVVAGTGFEVDVDRLAFLDGPMRARMTRVEHAPKLSPSFESSVRGLYFVGPTASFSFGPLLRFVCGAAFAAPVVAKAIAARASRREVAPATTALQQSAASE